MESVVWLRMANIQAYMGFFFVLFFLPPSDVETRADFYLTSKLIFTTANKATTDATIR